MVRAGAIVNLNVRPVFDNPDPGVHYYSFAVPGVVELGAVLRRVDRGPDAMMLSFDSLSVYAHTIKDASPAPHTIAPPPETRASKSARKTECTATARRGSRSISPSAPQRSTATKARANSSSNYAFTRGICGAG